MVGYHYRNLVLAALALCSSAVCAGALQQGLAVIPSSTRRENLASNLEAAAIRLTEDDMAQIAKLDRGHRLANPEGIAPAWD